MKLVRGTQTEQPAEIEFNVDTVYVRKDIQRIEEPAKDGKPAFSGWQYLEEQMSYKDYLLQDALENKVAIAELAAMIAKNGGNQ